LKFCGILFNIGSLHRCLRKFKRITSTRIVCIIQTEAAERSEGFVVCEYQNFFVLYYTEFWQ